MSQKPNGINYKQLREMSKKLSDYLNSPEGQKGMDDWCDKMESEKQFNNRWIERIRNRFNNTEDKKSLIIAFINHDKKISNRLFYEGIDGQSNLAQLVFEALKPLGKELPIENRGMFTSDGFMVEECSFEILMGQGTFVSINML